MLNFSGIGERTSAGRLLRLPLQLLPEDAVVPVLQGPLRGARWVVGSSNHGCWLGSYEWGKQRLFATHVRPGDTVLDIGANVGFYTLLSSRLVGRQGKVVSFEPQPRNLGFLRRHLTLNAVENVQVVEAAVGARSGRARFSLSLGNATGSLSEAGETEVTVVSLDELWREGRLAPPDVLKVDIEGGELDMLRGATGMLQACRPRLFLATHSRDLQHGCVALLESLHYRMEPIGAETLEKTDEQLCLPLRPTTPG